MIIVIGLGLFIILFVIFSFLIYKNKTQIFEIISSIMLFLLLMIGTYPVLGYERPKLEKEIELVYFNKDSFLDKNNECLLIKTGNVYVYKYCISEGNYDTQEIPFNSVEVIEDDEFKKPMIIVYAKKAKKNIWSLVFDQEIKHYIIKIPKDSIKNFK